MILTPSMSLEDCLVPGVPGSPRRIGLWKARDVGNATAPIEKSIKYPLELWCSQAADQEDPDMGPAKDMLTSHKPIRVVIADDHPVVLHSLVSLLSGEPDFTVVAACEDGSTALDAIFKLSPDRAARSQIAENDRARGPGKGFQ